MRPELRPLPSGLSTCYQRLSAPRRCYVIQALSTAGVESLSVRELARGIAGIESAGTTQEVTNGQYRNVYNALIQTHLLKLAAAGVIEYDTNRKVITVGENFQASHRLLAVSRGVYRMQTLGGRQYLRMVDTDG